MKRSLGTGALLVLLAATAPATLDAQLADQKALPLDAVKEIMAGSEAEALRNDWNVSIAIVDAGGHLLAFQRMDGAHLASPEVATDKARSSALFRRPTSAFAEAVAGGSSAILGLPGAVPLGGGVPIEVDGQVLGAVGVSGVTAEQDAIIAQAGIDALLQSVADR
jgi:glc operon protein GlcG